MAKFLNGNIKPQLCTNKVMILTFRMPSDAFVTQLSAPWFLLIIFQSSAKVLSCSNGFVPFAWKYSYTAESLTVPYDTSTCFERSWNVLKCKSNGEMWVGRRAAVGFRLALAPFFPLCYAEGSNWRPPALRRSNWHIVQKKAVVLRTVEIQTPDDCIFFNASPY